VSDLDVLVVGAGVSGLTTAVCLAEAGQRVRIRTAAPPHATTSAVAGALWEPYLVEAGGRVWEWARRTLDELGSLVGDPGAGVRFVSGVEASRAPAEPPGWSDLLDDFRLCAAAELPDGFVTGWRFTAPMVDMPVFLDYLQRRFRAAGGELETRPVASFAEAGREAPVVVNCAGLGARDLVPDPEVVPVRGQVVVVTNPGITEFFADTKESELLYILPHLDRVVLGGTAEPGVWSLDPDPETSRRILDRCGVVEPRLRGAQVLAERVGLRPVRPAVRVDEELLADGVRLLHNYGHGGSGITLGWGCAREIAGMVIAAP
jgi:D-amino-acid oxidase